MKNKTFLAVFSIVIFLCGTAFAQQTGSYKLKDKLAVNTNTGTSKKFNSLTDLNNFTTGRREILNNLMTGFNYDSSVDKNIKTNVSADRKKEKSPFLGALFSLVVPGSGEFYGGNLLKAVIFLGVEAAGWGVYAFLQHKGDVKTADFQAYADKYWDIHTYAAWLKDQGFQGAGNIDPNEQNWQILQAQIHVCESQNFSHTLPNQGEQQFYELIGKYQNFEAGWTNRAHVPPKAPGPYYYESYRDDVFVNYAYTREDANHFYNYATTSIYFVVLNHLLSAADAAWEVTKYNKRLSVQTGFRIERELNPYTFEYQSKPTFNVAFNF